MTLRIIMQLSHKTYLEVTDVASDFMTIKNWQNYILVIYINLTLYDPSKASYGLGYKPCN